MQEDGAFVKRVMITGVSGTGKSTLIEILAGLGFRALDLDSDAYSRVEPASPGDVTGMGGGVDWVWDEARVAGLLAADDGEILFVSGCSPNQGRFYDRFDAVVLLTAPAEVLAERLMTRTNNDFGKRPGELERSLALQQAVEPALRRNATLELDTRRPLNDVVEAVLKLVEDRGGEGG